MSKLLKPIFYLKIICRLYTQPKKDRQVAFIYKNLLE